MRPQMLRRQQQQQQQQQHQMNRWLCCRFQGLELKDFLHKECQIASSKQQAASNKQQAASSLKHANL
jgi:hypothetical protein